MNEQLVLAILIIISTLPIVLVFREKNIDLGKYIGTLTLYHCIYVALLFLPLVYTYLSITGTAMNWTGKLMAITASLIFYLLIRSNFKDYDFIWSLPAKHSHKKVLLVGLSTLLIMCALTIFFSKSKPINIEKLAFQMTMPGLDEEIWRAIALGLLLVVLKKGKYKFGHPAIWVVTIIFALGHALYFQNWELGFAIDAFIVSGTLGYILSWMTVYSKSILPALIFHNLINFSTNTIEMFGL